MRRHTREDDARLLYWLWLRDHHQTYPQIAEMFSVTQHAVSSALRKIDVDLKKSEEEPW